MELTFRDPLKAEAQPGFVCLGLDPSLEDTYDEDVPAIYVFM